ncbi:PTS fructose transporter subunit IIB [Mollicutes bacterium LVI A0039]|nr:PTS fructose transporter subunit IIB [Mollicutes bacterium LVI A0039]
MIKILTACGSGINSSQEIANTIVDELASRGITNIEAKAVIMTDVTPELLSNYDIFCPITEPDFQFEITIPIIVSGTIMYKVEMMYRDVIDQIEELIKKLDK